MEKGSIINLSSVTGPLVADTGEVAYATTKAAILGFTKSLAAELVTKNIRVNAVAPGPFWTALQPASRKAKDIPTFGSTGPMKRAGQPYEIAAIYVYLASNDSSYTTGQVIHVNGGEYKG